MKNRVKTKILGALVMLAVVISLFAVAVAAAPASEPPEFEFVNRHCDTLEETGYPIDAIIEYFSVTPTVKYENGKYMIEDALGAGSAQIANNTDWEYSSLVLDNGYWVCDMSEEDYNAPDIDYFVYFKGEDGAWEIGFADGVSLDSVSFYDEGRLALSVFFTEGQVENFYHVSERSYLDYYFDGVFERQRVAHYFKDSQDYFFVNYNKDKTVSYVEFYSSELSTYVFYMPNHGWYSGISTDPEYAISAPVGYESCDLAYFEALAPTTIDCTHSSTIPADCENPEMCAVCGFVAEGSLPLPHDWLDATYYAPKTCDRCGETEGEPLPPPCEHYNSTLTPNEDMTHTRTCYDCGETEEEACRDDYWYDYSETEHWNICECGRKYEPAEHTFEEGFIEAYSPTSHWIFCDSGSCNYSIISAHEDENSDGKCDVCEAPYTEVFDVYVFGVGLKDGQYVDNEGKVTDTKPIEGGYAHYEDATLTLCDFEYTGEGIPTKEYPDGYVYSASIFVVREIDLALFGESFISTVTEEETVGADGIFAEASITVKGDGSLEIHADNDGINMDNGDFTVESGHLIFGRIEYDEYGEQTKNEEIEDDAIDLCYGDLTVNGGKLTINSDDNALDVGGSIHVHGGVIYIVADDDGFNAEYDIDISDGSITVFANDHALDSDDGSITISGGVISLYTDEENTVSAKYDITISGGDISAFAYDGAGIGSSGGKLDMSGGRLTVTAPYYSGIYANEISVSGGEINVSSLHQPLQAHTVELSGGRFGFDASAYLDDGEKMSFDSDSNTWSLDSNSDLSSGIIIVIVAISVAIIGAGCSVLVWFIVKKKKT